MSLNLAIVRGIAEAEGFQAETVEKVLRLKQLLTEFGRHPVLKGKLVLKGGTALNLFYLDLARLSVDVDLNYTGEIERERMLMERPLIAKAIEQVCSAVGHEPRRTADDHALLTWALSYQNQAGRPDHVEVEINFLHRVCALPAELRRASRFDEEPECLFTVLGVEELMAGKMVAMIDRQHPRDLYDLYRFRKRNMPYNPELLRKLAVLFGSTLPHDLRTYNLERCERVLKADLERLLYPLLRAGDRPRGDEMLELVRPMAEAILNPQEEGPFLDALAAGRYEPHLLFGERTEVVERVRHHPALLWKAQHVAQHKSGKKK